MQQNGLQSHQPRSYSAKWLKGLVITGLTLSVLLILVAIAVWTLSEIGQIPKIIAIILSAAATMLGLALGVLSLLMPHIQKVLSSRKTANVGTSTNTVFTPIATTRTVPQPNTSVPQNASAPVNTPIQSLGASMITISQSNPGIQNPGLVSAGVPTPTAGNQKSNKTLSRQKSPTTPLPSSPPPLHEMNLPQTKGRGGILVWLSGRCPYSTLYVSVGHHGIPTVFKSANVEKHDNYIMKAVFRSLTPGDYTVFAKDSATNQIEIIANVLVEPDDYVVVEKYKGNKKI